MQHCTFDNDVFFAQVGFVRAADVDAVGRSDGAVGVSGGAIGDSGGAVGDCRPFCFVLVPSSSLDIGGELAPLDELPVIVGDECVLLAVVPLRLKAFADGDSAYVVD